MRLPDGYTLLLMTVVECDQRKRSMTTSTFNFVRDIAPVAGIARGPGVMEVNPRVPAKTVPEFIAYAKANPGKIIMATAGSGSILNAYGELFEMMTGVEMVAVPYGGTGTGAARPNQRSESKLCSIRLPSSLELIRAGTLRRARGYDGVTFGSIAGRSGAGRICTRL